MKLGIDFKSVAVKAAGHAVGAAMYTQVNKLGFMKNLSADPSKAAVKGAVTAALGYIVVPMVAKQLKLTGKKGGLIEAAGEGMGMVGVMIAANAIVKPAAGQPALFPQISGYEENPMSGLGTIIQQDGLEGLEGLEDLEKELSGYEQNPLINGSDDIEP